MPVHVYAIEEVVRIALAGARSVRSEESGKCSVVCRAAGLGDDLDHAAVPLAVLRFKGAGLYLDLLNEG